MDVAGVIGLLFSLLFLSAFAPFGAREEPPGHGHGHDHDHY